MMTQKAEVGVSLNYLIGVLCPTEKHFTHMMQIMVLRGNTQPAAGCWKIFPQNDRNQQEWDLNSITTQVSSFYNVGHCTLLASLPS